MSTRVGKRWTDGDLASLKTMFAEGLSDDAMAEKLGRTTGGIQARLEQLGLFRQTLPEDREAALTARLQDLIGEYGYDSVRTLVYKLGKPSTSAPAPARRRAPVARVHVARVPSPQYVEEETDAVPQKCFL